MLQYRMGYVRALLVVFVTFTLAFAASALAFSARVKSVRDGDSVTVAANDGALTHVRLYGIDAPEYRQPYGRQAKRLLTRLVGRKTVEVEPMDTDRYGRTVALLRLPDGAFVNEALVDAGAAWYYGQYCRQADPCERLRDAETLARAQRRGLWAAAAPERPSDWRREHKREEWYKAPVRVMKKLTRKVKVAWRR